MLDSRKLSDLQPKIMDICKKHIAACAKRGVYVTVTSTLRDQEFQNYLYALGRTIKVENGVKKSIVTQSKDLSAHGFGLAYDLSPIMTKNPNKFTRDQMWKVIAEEGKKLGMKWGGDAWIKIGFIDKPHFEMTDGLTYAQLRAGKRPKFWVKK